MEEMEVVVVKNTRIIVWKIIISSIKCFLLYFYSTFPCLQHNFQSKHNITFKTFELVTVINSLWKGAVAESTVSPVLRRESTDRAVQSLSTQLLWEESQTKQFTLVSNLSDLWQVSKYVYLQSDWTINVDAKSVQVVRFMISVQVVRFMISVQVVRFMTSVQVVRFMTSVQLCISAVRFFNGKLTTGNKSFCGNVTP